LATRMQRGVLPPRVPGVAMVDRAQSRRNDSAMLWAYVNMCRAAPYNWLVHVVTKSGSEMRQVLEASVRSFYTTRNRALKAHFGVNATQYSFDVALVRAFTCRTTRTCQTAHTCPVQSGQSGEPG
jgi:hypothetical protein